MAYVAGTVSVTVDNATPKVGQKFTLTYTLANTGGSNTVDVRVIDVDPFLATNWTMSAALGQVYPGGVFAGGGGGALTLYDVIANSASGVYKCEGVLHGAGAVTIGGIFSLTNNADGTVLPGLAAGTPVTVTAS
jgi:uncharacterized repeat protein (TIGR01451 family)